MHTCIQVQEAPTQDMHRGSTHNNRHLYPEPWFPKFAFVQVNNTHISTMDPEPQFIAEAIVAFQNNNANRGNNMFILEPENTMPKLWC